MTGLIHAQGNPAPELAQAVEVRMRGGRRIRVLIAPAATQFRKARGTVLVCPGFTEFIEKYFEVARDLQARGFAVMIIDWPGQGLSERMHRDPTAGHTRTFRLHVEALKTAVRTLGARAPRPHVVLAHSMGGAVALEALRTRAIEAAAAAFSAPMWGLRIGAFARFGIRIARLAGLGGVVARRRGPKETFANNPVTRDEARWRIQRLVIAAEPRVEVIDPTIAWAASALELYERWDQPNAFAKFRTPLLIATAADDTIVDNRAQVRMAKFLKKVARHVVIDDSRHEILMERDTQRRAFFDAFDQLCKKAGV